MEAERYTDADGAKLIYADEIASMSGVEVATIKHYATLAAQQRRARKVTRYTMPKRRKTVRRTLEKSNGQPLVVNTSVWREDEILAWFRDRGLELCDTCSKFRPPEHCDVA